MLIDWGKPTEAEKAALAVAFKTHPEGVTEFEAAEVMANAKDMLWYTQAKSWMEKPPDFVKGDFSIVSWKESCKFLVNLGDAGYDAEAKIFWNIRLEKKELAKQLLLLMDFGTMLDQARQKTTYVIAPSFDVVLNIILGNGWRRRFQMLQTIAKQKGQK